MLCALPQPILLLASEALQSACGDDATASLWTVFTKCKNHIEDGQRLENISWRVWHRDTKFRHHITHNRLTKVSKGSNPNMVDYNSESDVLAPTTLHSQDPGSLYLDDPSPTPVPSSVASITHHGAATPRLLTPASPKRPLNVAANQILSDNTTSNRRGSRRQSGSYKKPIGQTICQMLPHKLTLPTRRPSSSIHGSSPRSGPPSLSRQDTDSGIAESIHENEECEPEIDRGDFLPLLLIPSASPSRKELRGPCGPRVVVVNPTPHPTPPATPDVQQAPSHTFFNTRLPSTKNDTLSPPEIVPVMRLPAPAIPPSKLALPPAPPPLPSDVSSSTNESSSTGSTDDRPTGGKLFFIPKSSPQSQSPDDLRRAAPSVPMASTSSGHEERGPSSVASSNVRSVGSSASANRIRKSRQAARPGRATNRGKFSVAAAKAVPSSSQSKGRETAATTKKVTMMLESTDSGRSCSRDRGPDPLPQGNLTKKAKDRASRIRPPPSQSRVEVDQPPDGRLIIPTRSATQPLPYAHQPDMRNHNVFPQLQGLHLQQPLVPPANGIRRKVEIEKTSSEDEEDWSDVTEDEELGDEQDEGEGDDGDESSREAKGELSPKEKEAVYQRDFFKKLPSRSYSNLNTRTRSGLLSELFNPPVEWFPEDHAYRTSRSHLDLVPKRRPPGQGPMLWFRKALNDSGDQSNKVMSPPAATVKLSTSKSAAALPEMMKVSAGASLSGSRSACYRPRGPPSNVDVSESGEDDPDDTVQLSKSVAQKRLEALTDPNKTRPLADGGSPSPVSNHSSSHSQISMRRKVRSPSQPQAITSMYPYNLPPPDPPSSPATTRRKMWNSEMSQSTKISLLRERYISYGGPSDRRRNTMTPEKAAEEQRRVKLMRTRSLAADDFHTSGW